MLGDTRSCFVKTRQNGNGIALARDLWPDNGCEVRDDGTEYRSIKQNYRRLLWETPRGVPVSWEKKNPRHGLSLMRTVFDWQ